MAKQVSVLSVFVASPEDVGDERECLEGVIRELNLQWASKGIRLELVRWETHAYPGVGSDPQAVINEQIGDAYDIFLGLLWKRFGTPTPRAGSGTEEEFNRALARHSQNSKSLRILFYFKTGAINLSEVDPAELARVREFQRKLGPKGTLYWEFGNAEEFSPLVRIHLSRCVDDWGKKWGTGATTVLPERTPEACSISDTDEEEGFLDLLENATVSFASLTEQSERIGQSTRVLGAKMAERAAEIEKMRGGGQNFDLKVAKRICNTAAGDLEAYATIMDTEVPIFADRFKTAIESYAKAATILPDFSAEDEEASKQLDDAIQVTVSVRATMEEAALSMAGFRQAIATHPRTTTQYNRAKRHALRALDAFLDEIKSACSRVVECQKSLGAMRAQSRASSRQQKDSGKA